VNTGTLERWPDWRRWMWLTRAGLAGLTLADIWLGQPAPGLSGRHLVLAVASLAAGLVWTGWLSPPRVSRLVAGPVLLAGMVGACLAAQISPSTTATALPLPIGILAGSAFPLLDGAAVAACGLITLGVGRLIVTTHGFSLPGSCLAVVGGLAAGLWRSQYRLRAEQAELTAIQTLRAEQEHIRAQVLDERARIAREIHDILAHTLGGLVVQLDAADALLGDGADPEGGRKLVVGARRLAVEGLKETRQAIAALRADPVDLPRGLDSLAASDGQPGPVRYEIDGTPRRLSPEASLTVYRTAQEALANARKHAPGAPVGMTLSFGAETVGLRVANGPPVADPAAGPVESLAATGGGYGLNGLTERAELQGGTLKAGPDGNGWVVELSVPG